eukprot:INCI14984.1.p1 GENE.INCI14984.1~~INCI14984.1.p1  ORF type:complete len:1205 (-),score=228.63 INCI14984.1:27-3641(-)
MDINAAAMYLRGTSPTAADQRAVDLGDDSKAAAAPAMVSLSTRKAERLLNILLDTLPSKRMQQLRLRPNLKETVRWILQDLIKTNEKIARLLRRSPLDERALFAELRKALVFWIQERARTIKTKYLQLTNKHVPSSIATAPFDEKIEGGGATAGATSGRQHTQVPTAPFHAKFPPQASSPSLMRRVSQLTPDSKHKQAIRAAERRARLAAATNSSDRDSFSFAATPQSAARQRDRFAEAASPQVGQARNIPGMPPRGSMQMHTGANRSYVSEYTLFEKRAANFPLGVGGSPPSTPKRIVHLPRSQGASDATQSAVAAQQPAAEAEKRIPSLRNVNSPLRLPDLPRLRNEGAEGEAGRKWSIGTVDSSSGSPRGNHAKKSPLAATHEVGSLEWPSLDDDEDIGGRHNDAASDAAERHRAASAPLPGGVFVTTTSGSALDSGFVSGGESEHSAATMPASDSGSAWVTQHLTLSSGKEVDFLQPNVSANVQGGRGGRGRRSSVLAPPTSLALPGPHQGVNMGSIEVPQDGVAGSQGRMSGNGIGAQDQGGAEHALRNRINKVQTEFQKWDTLRQDLEVEIASVRKGTRMSTLQERDDLKNLYQQATEYSENLQADLQQLQSELRQVEEKQRAKDRSVRRATMANLRLSTLQSRVVGAFRSNSAPLTPTALAGVGAAKKGGGWSTVAQKLAFGKDGTAGSGNSNGRNTTGGHGQASGEGSTATTPSRGDVDGVRVKQLKMSGFDLWELFQIHVAVFGMFPALVRRRASALRAGKLLALGLITQDLRQYKTRMASLRDTSNGLMGGPAVPGVPPGMPGPPSFMINPLAGGPKKKKKQPKTRRLFWEKIDTSGAGGALWEEVVDMDAFVDRKEVEQLFGRGGAKKSKSKKSKGGGKKGKEEKEKDEKQESVFGDELRQMEICFRGLRQIGYRTGDSVVEALDNIDSSAGFSVSACERLMRLLPTTSQLDAIQQIPPEQMHMLDRYLYDVYQEIPDVEKRLEAIIFKDQFNEDLEAQSTVLKMQLSAVRQVVSSEPLKKALGVIRSIGNVLNDGDSERGDAQGFDLAILKRLTTTKSNLKTAGNSNKMNFLQFATIVARRSVDPNPSPGMSLDTLRIRPSLDELPRVRRFHVLDSTVCDCDVLINQFNKTRRYVQTLNKGKNESDLQPRNMAMSAFMAPFLQKCAAQVEEAERIKNDLVTEYEGSVHVLIS